MSITRSHLLRAGLIVLVGSACDRASLPTSTPTDDAAGPMPVELDGAVGTESRLAPIVATARTPEGGAVAFLDLGYGAIGIGERAPAGTASTAMRLIAANRASPLEVYLALGGRDAAALARMRPDHQRHARETPGVPLAPRALAAPPPFLADLDDPGVGSYACDGVVATWSNDWNTAFTGVTKYRAADYRHHQSTNFTWYPGALVYRLQQTNSKTYLGTCRGDFEHSFRFRVQRHISGAWVTILDERIDHETRYTFYSGIHAFYRGVAVVGAATPIINLGYAAAWSISPGLAP